jgi:hypothetical protein
MTLEDFGFRNPGLRVFGFRDRALASSLEEFLLLRVEISGQRKIEPCFWEIAW